MGQRDFIAAALALSLGIACSSSGTDGSSNPDGGGSQDGGVVAPPPATCDLPARAVDTSTPTTVVGTGTAASCTEAALRAAVTAGGIVTFSCGADPATITLTSEIAVSKGTTIDGGGKVTLSGGGTTRILHITSAYNVATPLLTVQNLTLTRGYTTDVANTTSTKQGGAAIFQDGGSLTVIGCNFQNNQCASSGQDVAGGAINGQGIGALIIVGSTFTGNSGSNGGAVGTIGEDVTVVNSTFTGNSATGTGGNPGNGGNGGGLTYDGAKNTLTMCGDVFRNNTAKAAGGAVFRVGYNNENVTIDRSTFDGNSADAAVGNAGGLYLQHVTINMSATTISGNTAHYGAGLWAGQSAVLNLSNVTVANNSATGGGGIWFANMVTGTILNSTIAGNTGDGLFGGDTGVSLIDTVVASNLRGTLDSTTNCAKQHTSGGPNLQFPSGGTLCTVNIPIGDPKLGPLQDNGGPVQTMKPGPGSAAIGAGMNCAPSDATGATRSSSCTLGAVEAQ